MDIAAAVVIATQTCLQQSREYQIIGEALIRVKSQYMCKTNRIIARTEQVLLQEKVQRVHTEKQCRRNDSTLHRK